MKIIPCFAKIAFAIFAFSLAIGVRAATFTVTPNVVSNDYTGRITFQMSGLSPGETVQVVQYFDFNGNGVVDAGELAVRGETVGDGQFQLMVGATNISVFRDEDGATNGMITASYWFPLAPVGGSAVGSYIFRVSSPSNHFIATNLQFAVVSHPYAQEVHGRVFSFDNPTNIPNAVVALILAAHQGNPTFIVGTAADSNGNYTLKAPPGNYQAVAFQPGYVGNLLLFPSVLLTSNATLTADIPLIAATTSLSGSLRDSADISLPAVPYAEIIASTTNGFATVGICDSNADFNLPVIPGAWLVGVLPQSAMSQAYLLNNNPETTYDVSNEPANNAIVVLKRATALISGRVMDSLGNPIPGVGLFANADFGQYNSFATSVSNGFYSLAIDAGLGTVNVLNPGDPPASNYIWPTPQFGINDGQVLSLNETGLVVTARFRSHVTDDTGAPITNLQAGADSYEYYGAFTFATTDSNGFLDMPIFGGEWNLFFLDVLPAFVLPVDLIFPDMPPFTITDGVNLTNDIVARTVTGTVSGYIHDGSGQGIANLIVAVTNHVGLTNFTLHATTDTNGNYSVAVFNGTWNVSPNDDTLENLGYYPVDPTNVIVPPAAAVANFIITSVPPPQILTTSLFDGTISNFYSAGLLVTNGSYPTLWFLISGELPNGLNLNQFGYISGTPTNLGLFSFTVKVQDPRGSNDVRALSINVLPQPTGPLQISTTFLPYPTVGCPYTNQLQATGGTPPYIWTLAADSDALPDGLNLDTNGLLSGIPLVDGYFYSDFQVSDSLGALTNEFLYFSVNTALQVYSAPLPPGTVGFYYYGYPPFSGGAQPQSWLVISNSLPPGLTNDPTIGIYGTPTTTGIFNFTIEVSDGCATIDLALSITNYPAPLQISSGALPSPTVGCPYTNQLQAIGGTPQYSWTLAPDSGPLPDGLNLDTNGLLSGIPTADGYSYPTIQVTDSLGTITNTSLYISVNEALQVSSVPLPPGEVGLSYYGYPPVSGGGQPQTWLVISNSLPPGFTNDPASGLIYGTPSTNGIYNFTLLVSDGCVTTNLTLAITNYPALQITTATLPIASLNEPYNIQLQITGGVPPFGWYASDSLGDLMLNYDGLISGTPSVGGTNDFLAQVYDSLGGYAARNFTLIAATQLVLDMPVYSGPHQFTFRVMGVSGQSYTVRFSTSLTNWSDLLTTNAPADIFFLTDTNATNASRFYQLKANP